MKMSKKSTALAFATALACALALPAFAAADTGTTAKATELDVTVPSTYVLTIPADQGIAYGQAVNNLTGELKVVGNIVSAKKVTVTVATPALECTLQPDTTIPYTLSTQSDTATPFAGADWTAEELRAATPTAYALAINVTDASWNAAKAGVYTAKVTFTAALADVENPA